MQASKYPRLSLSAPTASCVASLIGSSTGINARMLSFRSEEKDNQKKKKQKRCKEQLCLASVENSDKPYIRRTESIDGIAIGLIFVEDIAVRFQCVLEIASQFSGILAQVSGQSMRMGSTKR